LFEDTIQTVFGKGPVNSPLILVGEQPGDVEDKRGLPFVGPAGAMLWQCLEEAGVDRHDVYATNAVKHFKHEIRGKRRIHKKPDTAEIEACHPWLDAELRALKGRVIVALGATAARALLGRPVPIAASRGTAFEVYGKPTLVTYHPSAVLRADDRAAEVRAALVADLRDAYRRSTSG
jgi:uracil-DNA glycosylase family protein